MPEMEIREAIERIAEAVDEQIIGDSVDIEMLDEVASMPPVREVIKEVIKEVPSKWNQVLIRWSGNNRHLDLWINGIRVGALGLNDDMTVKFDVLNRPDNKNQPNEIRNVQEFREWLNDVRVREVLEGPPPKESSVKVKKKQRRELLESI